jgi:ribosomal protein S27AE
MRVACGKCGAPVGFDDLETPDIRNHPSCTVIIIEHPQQVACAKCGSTLALIVPGAKFGFASAVVPPKKQSPIILAGRNN